jgi:hypothetical protein
MKGNFAKGLVFLTSVAVIVYVLLYLNVCEPWPAILLALAVNIISSPIYVGLVEGLYNLGRLPLFWKTNVVYRNQSVRVSIAYLFRIVVKGKYLLIRNRNGNYYQLVGGAYKTLPGAERTFGKLQVKPDKLIETSHGIAKDDLRFTLPGKNVLDIIKWFKSREDRETSQWREFCEELLMTGILDRDLFRYVDYRYALTLQTPMQKAKNLECQEILIYEIFDLVPTTEQKAALEHLLDQGDKDTHKWADNDLINALGFDSRSKEFEYEIGPHTRWALNEKYG